MKIKTRKSALKRFLIKQHLIERKKAGKGHLLRHKNARRLRLLSTKGIVKNVDKRNIFRLIPNITRI